MGSFRMPTCTSGDAEASESWLPLPLPELLGVRSRAAPVSSTDVSTTIFTQAAAGSSSAGSPRLAQLCRLQRLRQSWKSLAASEPSWLCDEAAWPSLLLSGSLLLGVIMWHVTWCLP